MCDDAPAGDVTTLSMIGVANDPGAMMVLPAASLALICRVSVCVVLSAGNEIVPPELKPAPLMVIVFGMPPSVRLKAAFGCVVSTAGELPVERGVPVPFVEAYV